MRLYLVRHGETYGNINRILDTAHPGTALTETGWQQVNDLVGHLADTGIGAIFSSDLTRAVQSATPLATRLGLAVNARANLREIQAGELEGETSAAAYQTFKETVESWVAGELQRTLGGPAGETGSSVLCRVDAAIQEIESLNVPVAAIFAHGSLITYWTAMRGQGISIEYLRRHPHNGGWVVLEGTLDTGYHAQYWMGQEVVPGEGTPSPGIGLVAPC
ncbi:MAG: histidine phosphatase family protein [Trueperella sp.]|nr:histidine phosphatase family protein [Trueperella sp.]